MKKIIYALLAIFITSTLVWAATTYTTNYSLSKPGVGDTGWGAAVNTNFDTIDTQMKANADATATSAGLAAALSNETGTGFVVFSTSPTLTTPNIGSATGSITGNAGTATALAANGANCSAGEYPLGVDASGAVESCTDATTEIAAYAQPLDADLTTYAGITPSANVQSVLGAADYSAIRTLLSLVIGTNVQAYDADLTTYAGITPSANVQSLLSAANYAAMRTLLDLEAGTDFYSISAADAAFQPLDSDLTDIADGTIANNFVVTGTFDFGSGTFEIPNSTTLPATCSVGQSYMDTDATTGQRFYLCESTNTWALQGDGGGGGSGDVTAVGDCATGACFTGASGTTLSSNTDLIFDLDEDNNGTESFQILDGLDATVVEILETGLITTLVGIDAIGAVDMDYGSADVTDHTFVTDGTGDGEIVLPDGSIGSAEILDGSVADGDLASTFLKNIVEDTTPQLGGALDAQGNNITDLGDVTFKTGATGGTLRTGTSAADKFELQGYDVDGAAYVKVLEVDAGNTVTLEVFDESFTVRDTADETKRIEFELGGITTATTRTLTVPDESGTLCTTGSVCSGYQASGSYLTSASIDTYSELNTIVADVTLTHNGLIDTFAEIDAIVADKALVNKADGAVWLGVHDFGGATSLEIPNGSAPTVDAFGEIAGDNDLWAASRGAPVFFDGTASTALVNVLVSDTPSNGQVPKWNTGGTITWEDDTQSAGSATAWDDIADPDADATIAFAGFQETITTSLDSASGVVLKFDHTDADVANATTIFQIQSVDDADADLTYIKVIDDSGGTPNTVFSVGADGATAMDGDLTSGGTILATVGFDCVGAVDCYYGSADITDHTFVTDSTGDAEIVLPADSIGPAEIDSTTGAYDFGGVTSFEIPNGTGPTVDAAGEIAVDTTDDQLVYYGGAKRVIPYERPAGVIIEDLAATDDNYAFFMANDAITITGVGCNCRGTCSTLATFTLEDRGGNAMTITGTNPTCATTGAATFAAVTAGNTLTAGEMVAFDVTNTPTANDEYSLFLTYTVDAQ